MSYDRQKPICQYIKEAMQDKEQNFNIIAQNINTKRNDMDMAFIVFSGNKQQFSGNIDAELRLPSEFKDNFKIYDSKGNEVVYQILIFN